MSTIKWEIRHQRRLFVFMNTTDQTLPIIVRDNQVIQLRFAMEKTPHISGWLNTNNKVEYTAFATFPNGSFCNSIPRQNISSNQGLIKAKINQRAITNGSCSKSKFINIMDNGMRPTNKDRNSHLFLPIGFPNNAFISSEPSSLKLIKKVAPQ